MSRRADTVGVVGAGPFGTALASVLARAGRRVVLWSRDPAVVKAINQDRRCPRLPSAPLPAPLEATADPALLAREARFVVLAVVSTDVKARAREFGAVLDGSHLVVHAVGALATPDDERVSEAVAAGVPTLRIGALAGPARPEDLVSGATASMVIASAFDEVIAESRRLLNVPPALRLYGSHELVGVELASALSCAYTVGLGLADGLGVGVGARAVLVTRAIAEASRLGETLGATMRPFAGLAGLGNLLVRGAAGRGDADYELGLRLAGGAAAAAQPATEGGRAALAGDRMAQRQRVRMPVLSAIAGIVAGQIDATGAGRLVADTVAAEE
ncbi:MAG: NAD(P)-binding domain-containing protein [Kofleriaceae bacterium]|nr:NAD(P)-binding domain-containing protein [Kofleriaceae bacterium]MBP6837353.1 NAD(P)-binding domain-containing protein [Kofleriaceae bacterium]MBP9208097.1 NAD(P)-binding domain-containing protein [Kofleriaceae bacterium]